MDHPKGDQSGGSDDGHVVQLNELEEAAVEQRQAVRAAVLFETVRREGEIELNRPAVSLAFSAFASGLSMSLCLIVMGILRAYLPAEHWTRLVSSLGYTVGFLVVVMGRQQLFTENTVTAILPVLDSPRQVSYYLRATRLWAIVLVGNILGSAAIVFSIANSGAFAPELKDAFLSLGTEAAAGDFWTMALRGIFAGWLVALMVWTLPGAENARMGTIVVITYVIAVAGLSHLIAGSAEVLYAVAAGAISWQQYLVGFFVPVFLGNSAGGIALVSLLNYGQVALESEAP